VTLPPAPEDPEPSSEPKATPRRTRPLLGLIGVVVTVGALIGVLLRVFDTSAGLLVYATSYVPYGIVLAVSGVVLLVLAHWRWWAVVPAVIAVVSIAYQVPVMVPDPTPASAVPVVVMTLNLQVGQADPQRVVELVRTRHVDLLAVQELPLSEAGALVAAGLDRELPYVAARAAAGAQGTALWSRWPLSPRDVQTTLIFRQVCADVTPPGAQMLTVAAVHPASPGDPFTAVATTRWAQEQAANIAWLDSLPSPAVAVGDFNATLDQASMRALEAHGYQDAAEQAGVFWRPTWPYDRIGPPLIAIDHVLSRGGPVADQLAVETVPGTDHGALIVRLQVPTS
jgi:endonuclease/exonuclease/phosphatase (EEP) superfamily protein YafD